MSGKRIGKLTQLSSPDSSQTPSILTIGRDDSKDSLENQDEIPSH